jgi:regulator of sigma E protease
MWVVLYQGAQVPAYEQEPVVIGGFSDNSPAAKAGLTAGDRITTLDGKTIDTWDQFELDISTKPQRTVTIGYLENGQPKSVSLTVDSQWSMIGSGKFEMGSIGVLPQVHPQVIALSPNDPAAQAGMKPDDVILAVDGQQGVSNAQVLDLIKAHERQTLRFTVRRGNRILDVPVVPRADSSGVIIGAQISNYEVRTIEPGIFRAAVLSVQKNWEWTTLIVQTLAGLLTRQTSVKQLMGPVAIADLSGTAAQAGWVPLFGLMAMISLNLGLLNLMPIPVLDGGHIFILFLEGLARRDFSMRAKEKMLLAGFVLLLMLMVTVIYNDLMRIEWIQKLIPWH